jgi:hypothetical protein
MHQVATHYPPNPNFARLVTDLPAIAISAHALRRFVEHLQPDVPGAEQDNAEHPHRGAPVRLP